MMMRHIKLTITLALALAEASCSLSAGPTTPRAGAGAASCGLRGDAQYRPVPPPVYDRPLRDALDGGVVVVRVTDDGKGLEPVAGCGLTGVRYAPARRPVLACSDEFESSAEIAARFPPYIPLAAGVSSESGYQFDIRSSGVLTAPRDSIGIDELAPQCRQLGQLYFVRGLELGWMRVAARGASSAALSAGVASTGVGAGGQNRAKHVEEFGSEACETDPNQCVIVRAWMVAIAPHVDCAPGQVLSRQDGCVADYSGAQFDLKISVSGPSCDRVGDDCDYVATVKTSGREATVYGPDDANTTQLDAVTAVGADLAHGVKITLGDRDVLSPDPLGDCTLSVDSAILRDLVLRETNSEIPVGRGTQCGRYTLSATVRRTP